ncbi:MAG: hypothetical protein LBR22_04455 [Desulfovibrio sp.]|jgi:hypothetical protein|nr:hypothetical protein [Desulfovibrio sp.]
MLGWLISNIFLYGRLSYDDIVKGLNDVDELCKSRKLRLEVTIVGCAAIILQYKDKYAGTTRDVDISVHSDDLTRSHIADMSKLIAKKYGWDEDWLNYCFDSFCVQLHSKKLSVLKNLSDSGHGLFADVVEEEQLLALKCDALRDLPGKHDYEDAIFLMCVTEIVSREDLLENMKK